MAPTVAKRLLSSSNQNSKTFDTTGDRLRESKSAFGSSKKDKRIIKHSRLLSKIEKSKSPSKKRRRPSKKLISNLQSLANALPDIPVDRGEHTELENVRIRHKSLKSRPGATKKKELLITLERERFNKNMAHMFALPNSKNEMIRGTQESTAQVGTEKRWAAIRNFIQQNVEHRTRPEAVNSAK